MMSGQSSLASPRRPGPALNLKKNIAANYASDIYVTLAGILLLPLYIKYMGAEAYGLVGFFTMLQAWFVLLDLGLTPTIARESARFRAGASSPLSFRRLFRTLSAIFVFMAITGGASMIALSSVIASKWLNSVSLPLSEITLTVQVMGGCVALRWVCGLYRGVISGSERLVWLSAFNITIATARFAGVLVAMWLYGYTPVVFFVYQLFVALAEVLGLCLKARSLLPALPTGAQRIGWSLKPIKPVLTFSLTIAFTSSVWIMVTQTDKLILSSILTLSDYGYFTLAVLVAAGIMTLAGPISNAILPRMAHLHAQDRHADLIHIYRQSTQLVAVISGSAAITIAFSAEPLLYAWTGDLHLAQTAAPILMLYAIGNGILSMAAFPYYLQYAKGNLRLHLIGSLLTVTLLIPAIILVTERRGAVGAGYVWVSINTLYLLLWVSFIHRKLAPGLHGRWLTQDVARIAIPAALMGALVSAYGLMPQSRLGGLASTLFLGCCVILTAAINSSFVRGGIRKHLAPESVAVRAAMKDEREAL
jgi:O-antigen/teichoic acid export membrane protein